MGKDKDKDKDGKDNKENSARQDELAKSIGEELRRGELDSNELEVVEASKITRFYKVPSARFKTADDIIRYYGYRIGDKVSQHWSQLDNGSVRTRPMLDQNFVSRPERS